MQTLSFKPGLREWHFNVQRRIQRLLETDRWAFPARQYQVTQTSRAGLLTDLPEFDLGVGLTVRPAVTTGGGIPAAGGASRWRVPAEPRRHPAARRERAGVADRQHRLRRNRSRHAADQPHALSAVLSREAHVLSRGRRHLRVRPRPESRTSLPFFSRRIGLVERHRGADHRRREGQRPRRQTPTSAAWSSAPTTRLGVVAGRSGDGGRPRQAEPLARVVGRRDRDRRRSARARTAAGWPARTSPTRRRASAATRTSSSASGASPRVATISAATRTAHGFKVDYPNDLWDIAAHRQAHRPRLRSVARLRAATRRCTSSTGRSTTARACRAGRSSRCFTSSSRRWRPTLSGKWESYRVFIAPVNWRFRSGDRVEFNVNPTGERLVEPFEVADGVAIPPGSYHWRRYRLEGGHGAEAAALHAGHLVVRRFLRRRSRSDSCGPARGIRLPLSRSSSPASATSAGCRRATSRRRSSATASARQHLARPVDRQLRAVRHRQRFGRREHAAALDVHARSAISSSSTTTTCGRCSTAGSSTRISCWSSCSTPGVCDSDIAFLPFADFLFRNSSVPSRPRLRYDVRAERLMESAVYLARSHVAQYVASRVTVVVGLSLRADSPHGGAGVLRRHERRVGRSRPGLQPGYST